MLTYQGIYETNNNQYIGFIDSRSAAGAEKFFTNWQNKLNKNNKDSNFIFKLLKVELRDKQIRIK